VAAAAREANAIIDLRTFSWSDLFETLEATEPENVRLTSFQPRTDRDGQFLVTLRVQARSVPDLDAFLDALEKTGRFQGVLVAEEQTNVDGLINALVEAAYARVPSDVQPEAAAAAAATKGAAGG